MWGMLLEQAPPFMKDLLPALEKPPPPVRDGPSTRWEKGVTALNAIAKTVAKIDDDGVDVYCFPGKEDPVGRFMGVKKTQAICGIAGNKEPEGDCCMTAALSAAMDDAFEVGFDKPCSILVITAGMPQDKDAVFECLRERAAQLENPESLSITFVHVGSDPDASAFLREIDSDLNCQSADGEPIDLADTVKDEDIKGAMDELKEPGFMASGGGGGLFGAFAGMAMGAGAYYLYNKHAAAKRTEGWNGQWEIFRDNESTGVTVTVADDMEGNLAIEGYPEDDSAGEPSAAATYESTDEGYDIVRESGNGFIRGTIVDEHTIEWQDETEWREVDPEGLSWGKMAAAGFAGGAAGGAAGYLLQKKFFSKANNNEPANYKLLLDCSAMMAEMD